MTKYGGEGASTTTDADIFSDVSVALSLVGGEVLHEVTHTLNFLRVFLLQQPASGADEISHFAKVEHDRLQCMIAHLRRLKLPVAKLTHVSLSILVSESVKHIQESAAHRRLSIHTHIPADAVVRTDEECLRTALRKLLLDALERAPKDTPLTIAAEASDQQPLQLEISEEGEALSDQDATPLGWQSAGLPSTSTFRRALAHRLLRHLGWSLSYERRAQHNVFRLLAPLPMSLSL